MAKYTKRRHVRRTRKHGKRRGTRRHRGGGGTPKRGAHVRNIIEGLAKTAASVVANAAGLKQGSVYPGFPARGNKVAPDSRSPKK